ncbi:MAG: hypothetical protein E7561_00210 [Ruminococcaceae bacterium]|nr:hypothetical protein [Oscillospiraceae bacterium]
MKKITKILSLIIISIIVLSLFSFNVSAASCSSSASKSKFVVGDTVTITFNYSSDVPIYAAEGTVSFDSSKLQFKSANIENTPSASSVFFIDDQLSTATKKVSKGTYSFVFTAIADGTATVNINMFANNDQLQQLPATASHSVIIEKPAPKSSNANLSSLKVNGATISPAFNSNTTSYTAEVPFETEQVSISANAVDNGTFTGGGTFNLKVGENVRYIKVTAEDRSTTKTYKLTIVRAAEDPETQKLLNVQIDGADYRIVTEAPVSPLTGFNVTTVKRGNIDVSVMQTEDGKLNIYTLKNVGDENTDYYIYNEDEDKFQLLPYAIIAERMYIFANQKDLAAKGYTKTTLSIGNSTVDAFVSENEKLFDFYILYCYLDGKGSYYSYDTVENTMQRAPAFQTVSIDDIKENDKADDDKQVISSVKDVFKLGAKAKAIIIVVAVIIMCVIALIVLLIVRHVKLHKLDDMDEFGFDDEEALFDEVNILDMAQNDSVSNEIEPEEQDVEE